MEIKQDQYNITHQNAYTLQEMYQYNTTYQNIYTLQEKKHCINIMLLIKLYTNSQT